MFFSRALLCYWCAGAAVDISIDIISDASVDNGQICDH